ncbi:MAG: FadR family transcriptional regulator [Gammaproteobacteria bacterium]|nr:FadR family transcriptional regulator [Gammaproteobacteria bacterium]
MLDQDRDRPPATTASADRIAADLRLAIQQGVYADNDRLPPERQLADHFGASRGTIREALRRLEDTNLVIRKVGSGTFVRYRASENDEDIAKATSPIELIDVRFGIEPQMVRLAAINANGHDIENLDSALRRVCAARDPETFTEADAAFHLALADCTRNPLMKWLYQHLNEVRGHSQWSKMKDKILDPLHISEYNDQHRELFEAIAARDSNAAVEHIVQHLKTARYHLLGAASDPV